MYRTKGAPSLLSFSLRPALLDNIPQLEGSEFNVFFFFGLLEVMASFFLLEIRWDQAGSPQNVDPLS